MKDPPLNKSPEARKLRELATTWGKNIDREPTDDEDRASAKLNRALLQAALAYANAVFHQQPVFEHTDKVPGAPARWECLLCHRDKFTRRCPHKCVGGYRKKHLKWRPIYAAGDAHGPPTD
jgi:hypothetical protein